MFLSAWNKLCIINVCVGHTLPKNDVCDRLSAGKLTDLAGGDLTVNFWYIWHLMLFNSNLTFYLNIRNQHHFCDHLLKCGKIWKKDFQVSSSAIGFRVRTSEGEAAIVEEDILASDGVIHVIDAVVWILEMNFLGTAQLNALSFSLSWVSWPMNLPYILLTLRWKSKLEIYRVLESAWY